MPDTQMVLTFQVQVIAPDPDEGFARHDELARKFMAEDDVLAVWMPTPRVAGHEQIVIERDEALYLLATYKMDRDSWDDDEEKGTPKWLEECAARLEAQIEGSVEVV